jgi:uncharacterized protein with PIN domain
MSTQLATCPICGGPIVLVVSQVFDQELNPVSGRLEGRLRHQDARSPMNIPTTGSRTGCTNCGRSWTGREFERVWKAAGRPVRP